MKRKTMCALIKVFVVSNPIGRAIWEEAASYNRGIGLAIAKKMMDMDGVHSDTVDGYVDYMRKNMDDHNHEVTLVGYDSFSKKLEN